VAIHLALQLGYPSGHLWQRRFVAFRQRLHPLGELLSWCSSIFLIVLMGQCRQIFIVPTLERGNDKIWLNNYAVS